MKKSKSKHVAILIFAVLCFAIVILLFFSNIGKTELYRQNLCYRDSFGYRLYHTINHKPSLAEIHNGKHLAQQLEKYLSASGTEQEVKKQVPDAVWKYYYQNQIFHYQTGKISCRVKFLNLKSTKSKKYLWCTITRTENFKTTGNISGEEDVLTLIQYTQNTSTHKWEISKIQEAS